MKSISPPVPQKIPYKLKIHGDTRIDCYYWMKNRDSKQVLDYLREENRYTEYVMKDTLKLQRKIFRELKSRIKEDDSTYPVKYRDYFYFKKYRKGREYPLYLRKSVKGKNTEIVLDVNKIALGHSYCDVKSPVISPLQNIIGYAVDYKGRRFYDIYFKDLKNNRILKHSIKNTSGNFVFSNDLKTVFYVKQNPQTLRCDTLYMFNLETGKESKIYYEKDEEFSIYIWKSKTENYIFLNIESTLTTEIRYLPDDGKSKEFKIFKPREKGIEYYIEDGDDRFFIMHNYKAKNFKLSSVFKTEDISDKKRWKDILPHRENVYLENFDVFKNNIVVLEKENAVSRFRIINRKTMSSRFVKFPDKIYSISFAENPEYDSNFFRYYYESMIVPYSIYDYDFKSKRSILRYRKKIPNYNSEKYKTERLWIKTRDGKELPVDIVYKKKINFKKLYLYGYGAYGYSLEPEFNSTIFPLVDRGFVYAVVHCRGGSELGRKWYDDGRKLKKKNTFYDFIDATETLIKLGYGKKGHVYAEGGSAGGLLIGAVINMTENLYNGVIAEVPFVDLVTTMLDKKIPLTTSEFDEWGNPEIKRYYYYMKSYSPYDSISRKCYPNILVTAGYHDSQVQYWEPAKWVAKLREYNTCKEHLILLKTDMSSGHSGKTGRYSLLKDISFKFAFIMKIDSIFNE